ncbi:MAG: PEP/pyruvate-binding domain-containing protein [Deltaproteobacteria bacterium]|nr:PEP/pyruvate-binding domain-containing protein [Deltaproteobacteria bacterium]
MNKHGLCALWFAFVVVAACGGGESERSIPGLQAVPVAKAPEGACVAPSASMPDFLDRIGCREDFVQLSAAPLDATIPGARSMKVILDQADGDKLYFQNTTKFPVHYKFASMALSGNGKPVVPPLSSFNQTEYYSPDRRFILAAVTYYDQAKVWTLELAPYDTANAAMQTKLFAAVKAATYFGTDLVIHPTSDTAEATAATLPPEVPFLVNEILFTGIDYQPLNIATSYGRLRFVKEADLHKTYLSFRDIVVLDRVPNDIATVVGIITQDFQTPLSHLNVLSQNRRTPNMSLRGAVTNPALTALKDKWVKLEVGAFAYTIVEVPVAEADAWWETNKPAAVGVPRMDLTVTALKNIEDLVPNDGSLPLREAIKTAIPSYGGKAAHFSSLKHIPGLPVPRAFGIPVFYYQQHLDQNGISAKIAAMLADPLFKSDPATRDKQLTAIRADIIKGKVDPAFEAALFAKLKTEFPRTRMKFRSSTNAEDLEGFTGAGLYESYAGQVEDPDRPVLRALKSTWASVWLFRAFEEREYRSIDHKSVGMAILCSVSFVDEEANGVALTANPFDTSGLEPAFYVNVQKGETSVVLPGSKTTTDELIYHYYSPGQPAVYLAHSSLVGSGKTVITREQMFELGGALDKVHEYFRPAYGTAAGFYAMDVEFKFDDMGSGKTPTVWIKQARPHPGRGQ